MTCMVDHLQLSPPQWWGEAMSLYSHHVMDRLLSQIYQWLKGLVGQV